VYELAHSYLLTEIQVDPEAQSRKAAQELLAREVLSHRRYGTLLDPQKLSIIQSQKDNLVLDNAARELLRLSQSAKKRVIYTQIAVGVTVFAVLLVIVVSTGRFDVPTGALMTVIFLVLAIFGGRALIQRNRARHARRIAQARGLAAEAMHQLETNSELSLLLALEAVEQADIVQAESILREVLLQIRPWQVLESQSDAVLSAAWSPDGSRIVLGLRKGDIQVWDAQTNTLQTLLTGHTEAVREMRFSPAGDYLASASALTNPLDFFSPDDGARGSVYVWDMAGGQLHGILEGHTRGVFSLTWHPGGKQLATASADGTVRVWDVGTLKQVAVFEQHTGKVRGIDWHPTGKKLASCSEGELLVWAADTLTVEQKLVGHRGEVFDVSWTPDGCCLATAGKDGTVRLWHVNEGTVLDVLVGHKSFVRSVRWHPNGRLLASSAIGNNKIIIWDTEAGQPAITLTGHADWIRRVDWHPRGDTLLSASDDGTARVWQVDVIPGVTIAAGHTDEVNEVDWHPDGTLLASGSKDGTARVWLADSGAPVAVFSGHTGWVWDVAWRPDGRQLATTSTDGSVRVWHVPPLAENGVLESAEPAAILTGPKVTIYGMAWSPDNQLLATASSDKIVRIWEAQTGATRQTLLGHEAGVLGVAFSPDGSKLASSSADETIVVWDLASGKPQLTLKGHTNFVWDVVFDPGGQFLASASGDATARIWDLTTGEQVARLAHPRSVASLAWSHGGQRLVTTSDDGVAYVWDTTGHQLTTGFTGHNGGVWGATWSPDDARVATAAADGTVRIFYTRFEEILNLARTYKTRELTEAEREQFMGEPVFGESGEPKSEINIPFLKFR